MLEIKSLGIKLGQEKVLRLPSLSLPQGHTIAFCGYSGSGKTMTAKSLIGMLPPGVTLESSSIINYDGENLLEKTKCEMRDFRWMNIGWIDQDPNIFFNPVLKLHEHVLDKVGDLSFWNKLLESLNLSPEVSDYYPHQLSGGMKQRAMLAYALVHKPKLIIADEPSTALDRQSKLETLKLLKKAQSLTNSILIFITHEIDLAWNITDSLLYFANNTATLISSKNQSLNQSPLKKFFEEYMLFCTGTSQLDVLEPNTILQHALANHELKPHKTMDTNPDNYNDKDLYFSANQCCISVKENIFKEEKRLLENVSCLIELGKITMIVGQSGSGKSSFMNFFKGTYQMLGERQFFNGRKKVAMLFQNPAASLNPYLTIQENLFDSLEWSRLTKHQKIKKVCNVLIQVGFSDSVLGSYPNQFSGGQQQRLALSRALLFEPEVLLLDEPTSSLDIQTQNQVIDLIITLQQELKLTVLWITHDKCLVNRFANTFIKVQNGQIQQYIFCAE